MIKLIIALMLLCSTVLAEKPKIINITLKNTVLIYGEINMGMLASTVQALIGAVFINGDDGPLNILIISPGGDVDVSYKLAKIINNMKNINLICRECDSAAAGLFVASNHRRFIVPNANMTLHEMKWNVAVNAATCDRLKEVKQDSYYFDSIFSTSMKISLENYRKKIKNRDWNINGVEAVKLGLADEVVELKCDEVAKEAFPETCKLNKN